MCMLSLTSCGSLPCELSLEIDANTNALIPRLVGMPSMFRSAQKKERQNPYTSLLANTVV